MALTTIIEAVEDLLEAIPGIGQVHAYYRHVESEADLAKHYRLDGLIHAWVITRDSTDGEAMSPRVLRPKHNLVIHGLRAVSAAEIDGEKIHQEMTEEVFKKLAQNHHLPNDAGVLSSPRVIDFGAAMFAGLGLCWYAQLGVTAEDRSFPNL